MAKAKRISGLSCSAPADKMVRLVLRAQLRAMCNLQEKALDWSDPEGVHDMRVGSRRLRSSMSDFRPYVRKGNLPRMKLRAIAKYLGNVRDEDVALIALEELKAKAKEHVAEGIEILMQERRDNQKEARAVLQKAIKRAVVEDLRKEFLSSLQTIEVAPPKGSHYRRATDQPLLFGQLGVGIIEARLKDLAAASRDIYSPFEIKDIHEVRILAKRLRYAIEMFATCWGEEMREIAKEVSLLQTALGEMHDSDMWIEKLSRKLKQIARRNPSDEQIARLREGATWLLKHFAKERMEYYREALARWQQWEAEGLPRLRSILAQNSSPAPPPAIVR